MKTALQELIEWAETPEMSYMDNKSIMTKMKELLEKERETIILAHKNGMIMCQDDEYIYGIRDEYFLDQYSQEYYDKLFKQGKVNIGTGTYASTTGSPPSASHCTGSGNEQNNRTPFGKGWMGKRK